MKKILYLFITIIGILGITDIAYANEAKCVYGENWLIVNIKGDKITTTLSEKKNANGGNIYLNSQLKVSDFTNNKNELVCLDKITYKSSTFGMGSKYDVTVNKGNLSKKLNEKESYVKNDNFETDNNDDSNINDDDTDGENFTRICKYKIPDGVKSTAQYKQNIKNATVTIKNNKDILITINQIEKDKNPYDENFEYSFLPENFNSKCPNKIYYHTDIKTQDGTKLQTYSFYRTFSLKVGYELRLVSDTVDDGTNSDSSGNKYLRDDEDVGTTNIQLKNGCDVLSSDLKSWLIKLLDLVKVAALMLTIVLSMFDFFKGVTSSKGDAMKKVWESFSRRLIAVVILFLLPLILEFILGLVTISGVNKGNPLCGIR